MHLPIYKAGFHYQADEKSTIPATTIFIPVIFPEIYYWHESCYEQRTGRTNQECALLFLRKLAKT